MVKAKFTFKNVYKLQNLKCYFV